jgi:hypothetical protein
MKNEQPQAHNQSGPRRAIERDYLVALAEAVPVEKWREICLATVEAAKAGDPKARDWLTRYLIGDSPMKLLHLAADERSAYSADTEIDRESKSREQMRQLADACSFLGNTGSRR